MKAGWGIAPSLRVKIPPTSALLHEARQLRAHGAPAVLKAQFIVHALVGIVLVHGAGGIERAVVMVGQGDDGRHEWLFCRSPAAGQGIGEDDPFALDDLEKAPSQVW